jgi:hypothetical protein
MNKNDLVKHLDLYPKGLRKVYDRIKTQHGVKVTPQKAVEWIAKLFKGQRAISRTHVLSIAEKMREGSFIDTGQDVAFDWYDRLIDGQHRLLAIIESGVTVEMTVTWGLDPIVYLHRDEDPKGRSVGAYLSKYFTHPDRATGAYRIMLDYDHLEKKPPSTKDREPRRGHVAFGRRSVGSWKSNREKVLSWCVEHQKALRHVLEIVHDREAKAVLPPPGIAAGFYLWIYQRWPAEADAFFKGLIDGVGLTAGSPIFQTRRTILRLKTKGLRKMGTGVPYYEWGAILFKGWNMYMEGADVGRVTFTANEAWPRLTTRARKGRGKLHESVARTG